MFKLKTPQSFRANHNYITRFRDQPQSSRHRLAHCQNPVSFTGPIEWNNLPNDLRNTKTINSFKRKLKIFFIEQY